MTESQQPKRGWFSDWRENRRAQRGRLMQRRLVEHKRGSAALGGMYGASSPHQHGGPISYGSGGGDGGGCGGDGGGGGC